MVVQESNEKNYQAIVADHSKLHRSMIHHLKF